MKPEAEWREGWPVVMGAALALGTALPVWNYVSSLFVAPRTAEFGWTRGQLASASASAFLGSLAAPLIGKLADAVGSRPVLLGGLAGYAAAFVALAYQPGTLAAYTVIIMLHTMIGIACGGAIFSRAVAGWFNRNRGLALGLTMTGVPLAAALITPALSHIITSYGWQNGFLFLASLSLLLGLPAVIVAVKDRHRSSPGKTDQADRTRVEGADWYQIVRSRGFWLLALSLVPINAAGTGIMSAMMPMLTDAGIGPARAATLVSLFAISVIVARLATGWLIDRLPSYAVAGIVASIPAAGCTLLVMYEGNYLFAAIALILIGVQQGAEIDLVGYLVAKLFGLRNYASVYGVCVVFLGLSGALGVAWFGQSFDANASYRVALALSVPCYLIGAALLLALRSDIRRSNVE